jgi:hypothetical protein
MRRGLTIAMLSAAAMLVALGGSAAASVQSTGMRDTRYCEIFTIFLSPSPIAKVNNSYNLNNCRQGWWESLDTGDLAAESGANLVTLNGPRYWLMDKVVVYEPGPISTFAGKEFREVATIDLTKVGLAPPPAYTQVKIQRGTKFVFRRDRPAFMLTDPNGRKYVMQSYSQIVDPELTYDQLRGIGDRIGLPDGWSYGISRPKKDIVLKANGQATIVQDGLKNTYQRSHESRVTRPAAGRRGEGP